MNMKSIHTKMDNHGRLLVPLHIRNQLHYKKGDNFVIRVINNELHIVSLKNALLHAQELVRKTTPPEVSLVDELIAERRAEAKAEEKKFLKYSNNS